MTTPEQRQWDLLTGPSLDTSASAAWVDERIRTRTEVESKGQKRLQMTAEERSGLVSKVNTFAEVHKTATSLDSLNSTTEVSRGAAKWIKLAAAAAVVLPAALSLGISPAAATEAPSEDIDGTPDSQTAESAETAETAETAESMGSVLLDPTTGPPTDHPNNDAAVQQVDGSEELLEQARADLDCDVGFRDMLFNPESDPCDALTAAQIKYKNTLDTIDRSLCDPSIDFAEAGGDPCERLPHAHATYQQEIATIVRENTRTIETPVVDKDPEAGLRACEPGQVPFELHEQPDGSTMPGADLCESGGVDAAPVVDDCESGPVLHQQPGGWVMPGPDLCVIDIEPDVPESASDELSPEKIAEQKWKEAQKSSDWAAKKEAEAIWLAKLEAEKAAETEKPVVCADSYFAGMGYPFCEIPPTNPVIAPTPSGHTWSIGGQIVEPPDSFVAATGTYHGFDGAKFGVETPTTVNGFPVSPVTSTEQRGGFFSDSVDVSAFSAGIDNNGSSGSPTGISRSTFSVEQATTGDNGIETVSNGSSFGVSDPVTRTEADSSFNISTNNAGGNDVEGSFTTGSVTIDTEDQTYTVEGANGEFELSYGFGQPFTFNAEASLVSDSLTSTPAPREDGSMPPSTTSEASLGVVNAELELDAGGIEAGASASVGNGSFSYNSNDRLTVNYGGPVAKAEAQASTTGAGFTYTVSPGTLGVEAETEAADGSSVVMGFDFPVVGAGYDIEGHLDGSKTYTVEAMGGRIERTTPPAGYDSGHSYGDSGGTTTSGDGTGGPNNGYDSGHSYGDSGFGPTTTTASTTATSERHGSDNSDSDNSSEAGNGGGYDSGHSYGDSGGGAR